jgi:hypothetical protein
MEMRNLQRILLAIVGTVLTFNVHLAYSSPSSNERAGADSKAVILSQLRQVLEKSKWAGRVYYGTPCAAQRVEPNIVRPLSFPHIVVHAPSTRQTGLAAVRDLFRGNKDVFVREIGKNLVGITIGRPDEAILETKITRVELSHEQQYDPDQAIGALLRSKDIISATERLHTHHVLAFEDRASGYPPERAAHLPSSMNEVTLDQALGAVASTFGGIVVYGACVEPRLFDIEFYATQL